MKKHTTLLLCLAPLLLACTQNSQPTTTSTASGGASTVSSDGTSAASSSQAQTTSEPTSGETYLFYQVKAGETKEGLEGSPWVNSVKEGIAKKLIKPSLKDDFYLNKTYDMQIQSKLEEGDIAIGGMPGAIKEVSKRTTKILTEKTTSSYSDALRSVYSLFANPEKSAEVQYVKSVIDEIKAISTLDGLVTYLSTKGYDSVWPLFEIDRIGKGKLQLREANMGLTPLSVNFAYVSGSEENKKRVEDTTVYLLGLYGYDEAGAKAVLEKNASLYQDCINAGYTSETATVSKVDETFPHARLNEYFTRLGYAASDELSIQGSVARLLKTLSDAFSADSNAQAQILDQFKSTLIFRLGFISVISRGIKGENGYIALTQGLDSNTRGYNEDMFEKDIFGSHFRDVYDRVYIDNFETKQRRESIVSLMKEVASEYKLLLNGSTWLDQSTRQAACDKLDAMTFDACYPAYLESLPEWNYTAPSSFMKAVNDYVAWSRLAKQPANDKFYLWGATVTTINGVYNLMTNSFVIFDGLLASDSYGVDMPKEQLYGSIGAVIGHEISHAFDVNGAAYDKHGSQTDWWTPKDKAAYAEKVNKIKAVWSQYENKPGLKLSCDEPMLGEIIADMGGVSVCLRLGAKQQNFDYDKFFSAYADMHGSIISNDMLENFIYGKATGQQDSHPISVFRVNGVVNQFDKFYDTYGVKENDKMYVASENRLNIWG